MNSEILTNPEGDMLPQLDYVHYPQQPATPLTASPRTGRRINEKVPLEVACQRVHPMPHRAIGRGAQVEDTAPHHLNYKHLETAAGK